MYSPKLTYSIYDLNSSLFVGLIQEILEAELTKQISDFGNDFLPPEVKTDEYLLNPISDNEINPAFCSILKEKSTNVDAPFHQQQNVMNTFIIGIMADGLTNLRKIADAIFIILNDMDIKNYIFNYQNSSGDNIISDSSKYSVTDMSTEFEVSKTINDKNIIYGYLILQAEIAESAQFNTHQPLREIGIDHKLGDNEINVTQEIKNLDT